MITAEELIQIAKPNQQNPFKLATVVGLFDNGTAKIQFDGETEPSEKEYAYFSSYRPVVGDRVLLAKVGGTYVIMNSIAYNQPVQPAQPSNLAK